MINNPNGLAHYPPKKKPWYKEKLIVLYHFENGVTTQYRQEFRRLWKKYYVYNISNVKHVQLTVGVRSNPLLEHRLVKKKHHQAILVNR
jgi:hypothetical protein